MHLLKLTKVLQAIDNPTLKRLQKYAHSPYFNVYSPSVDLLDYMVSIHPFFLERKCTVQFISNRCASLATYSHQMAASSRLVKAIEHFLALEEWQKEANSVTYYKLKAFKEIGHLEEFSKGMDRRMAYLDFDSEQNIDTFFDRHLLTELALNGFNAKLKRTTQNNIMPVVQTLDAYHAVKKLRYLCEAINRKLALGANYKEELVPPLLKTLEPYNTARFPYVYLFINVYHLLSSDNYEDSELYYKLIKYFVEKLGPTPTVCEAMTYAINQTLHWNNQGHEAAGNEYLWWINWKMKHDLLLDKGKIMPVTFRNIISIAAINRHKPEDIKQLIKKYGDYLPENYQASYLPFANGLYFYSLKNHKRAIQNFLTAQEKEEPVFSSVIRRWQWMSLYECDRNDIDTLLNHLSSFDKYLHRNRKELHAAKPVFELFTKYGTELVKSTTREEIDRQLTALGYEDHFPGKPWLIEQFLLKNKNTRTTSARAKVLSNRN